MDPQQESQTQVTWGPQTRGQRHNTVCTHWDRNMQTPLFIYENMLNLIVVEVSLISPPQSDRSETSVYKSIFLLHLHHTCQWEEQQEHHKTVESRFCESAGVTTFMTPAALYTELDHTALHVNQPSPCKRGRTQPHQTRTLKCSCWQVVQLDSCSLMSQPHWKKLSGQI